MLREAFEPFVLCVPKRAEPFFSAIPFPKMTLRVSPCSPLGYIHLERPRRPC